MDTVENYLQIVEAQIERMNAAIHMEKYPWCKGWEHEWQGHDVGGEYVWVNRYRLNVMGDAFFTVTTDNNTAPISGIEWENIVLAYYIGSEIAGDAIDGVTNWDTLVRFFLNTL